MAQFWIFLALSLLVGFGAGGYRALAAAARRARHARLRRGPFPPAWEAILDQNLPPYRHLPTALRIELHGLVQVFLAEKTFEGCGGLALDDEIRVTIAAQACLLIAGKRTACYPKLRTVLVYPSTYVAGRRGLFNQEEAPSTRLGESWTTGVVVLAWDSVKRGATNFEDGQNVAFHEFAHQLDQEDGAADGAPILDRVQAYRSWALVLSREYKALRRRTRKGRKSVIYRYGATNPAEFFAVATETFFEKPEQLAGKHPELFQELQAYYELDPRKWG